MPVLNNSLRPKRLLISFAVSLGICAVCMLAACCVVYMTNDPGTYSDKAALTALITSSFASGIPAVKINGGTAISSLIVGILLTLFLALISVSFFNSKGDIGSSLLMHLLVPAISFAGGIISRKRKKKPVSVKRKLKRRR